MNKEKIEVICNYCGKAVLRVKPADGIPVYKYCCAKCRKYAHLKLSLNKFVNKTNGGN